MLKNYLKLAWRNLWRNKFFTFLNILGLSLGMVFSLLILLWVQNELSIDAYHENDSRLYAVYEKIYSNNIPEADYETPGILADELKKSIPEVEYAVNVRSQNEKATFRADNKLLKQDGMAAGADFFKMFSYPLIQGTPETALNTENNIAISDKMAKIFFNSAENAIGKALEYENKRYFTVSAVFADLPENTSRKFDFVINWDAFLAENAWAKRWDNSGPLTYFMLQKNANRLSVDKKITRFLDPFYKNDNPANRTELGIQKFSDVYLHSSFRNGEIEGGRIEYVNLFSIVALFIILIACINFMNLTTALSVKRAKEIGIRKVVGAVRPHLIAQFIGESLLLTTIAIMFSLLLLILLLPAFNYVTEKQIAYPFGQIQFWLKLIGLVIITGLISGSYPALFLSSFNPLKVLKGSLRLGSGAIMFRKSLVIFQFVLSVVLIICTIVVSKQISFIQAKNLGYDRENLIYVSMEGELINKYKIFKDEGMKMPGILSITRIAHNPTNLSSSTSSISWEGKAPDAEIPFVQTAVGYDFTPTMKLRLLDGRDFSREFATDSVAYLVNEAAAKMLGYDQPVGRSLTVRYRKGNIVGLLKDFHFRSLQEQIQPLILSFGEEYKYGNLIVRTKPGQTKQAIQSLETLSRQLNPGFPLTYVFSDEEYHKLYQNEQMVGKLSNSFAFLAIFISCLGLLGLAIFTAQQRIKEISVRKILGASVTSLFALLSKEFLILVFIALLIASPIAWYVTYKWLQNFAYHTTIDWWIFLLSGLIILVITLLTISYQAIKAALVNPIKSLRSE